MSLVDKKKKASKAQTPSLLSQSMKADTKAQILAHNVKS